MIAGSQYMPDWLSDWIFLAGTLLDLFSNPIPYAYLVNMYVVDVCGPEDRWVLNSQIFPLLGLNPHFKDRRSEPDSRLDHARSGSFS